uniref:Membrane protein n=1 Tax=Cutibacterium granulosum DSM 20700 TaxID=1160719 RepID=A0A9X5R1L9_9ACTN
MLVVCLAGFMMTTAALNSRGQDLRPDTDSSMTDIVRKQAQRNADLQTEANGLRSEVEKLSREKQGTPSADPTASTAAAPAGLQPVKGPAIEVVLSDAPLSVDADGVDANMLVVHQQDIQAVVNALWSGGAEAMTIQGQRVTAMTAVKCVGNTVVLHGVPYAPPYHIQAIGDLESLHEALDESESVRIYQQYVDAYQLGWKVKDKPSVTMPAFAGQAATGVVTPRPKR